MIIRRPEGVVEDVAFPAFRRFCRSLHPPKHPFPGDNLLLYLILFFSFFLGDFFFKPTQTSSSWWQFVTFTHFFFFLFSLIWLFSSNIPKHPFLSGDNLLLLIIFLLIIFSSWFLLQTHPNILFLVTICYFCQPFVLYSWTLFSWLLVAVLPMLIAYTIWNNVLGKNIIYEKINK